MICHRCSAILPHDLAHVREHDAMCTGNSVEDFLGKFSALANSVERMARACATVRQEHDHACAHDANAIVEEIATEEFVARILQPTQIGRVILGK